MKSKYDFVILTPGRSGSTHLAESLNACSDISVHDEIFNRSAYTEGTLNHYIQGETSSFFRFLFHREKTSSLPINYPLKRQITRFLSSGRSKSAVAGKQGFRLTNDQLEAYPFVLDYLMQHLRCYCLHQFLNLYSHMVYSHQYSR